MIILFLNDNYSKTKTIAEQGEDLQFLQNGFARVLEKVSIILKMCYCSTQKQN